MATLTPETDANISTALQQALHLRMPVNTNIHDSDQMFTFIVSTRGSKSIARSEYFVSGSQLFKTIEQLVRWKFGSFDNVPSLLDFASGYGRLTRFLVEVMPADRIWVSDIQADAVAFQQAEFGVHGFLSATDPDTLLCDQSFDCIFVASLFSHLPSSTFVRWLKKLSSLLKPGGLLVFTVHDASHLPPGETMPESGIWFSEASEIASVDTKDYGTAIVTEHFVRDAIIAATGRPIYRRIPSGLLVYQDIYLVVNDPSPDFSGLVFAYLPNGSVDHALWMESGRLYLRGWAADVAGASSLIGVQIFVDGQLCQECRPCNPRPDVRQHLGDDKFLDTGWECSFTLPDSDSTRSLLVKAVSSSGADSLLYLGTIDTLLPVGRAETCLWIKPGELYMRGWAADVSTTGSPVEVQIFVDGQLCQKCVPSIYRPELQMHFNDERFLRAGWECFFHLPDSDPTRLLTVKSFSSTGFEALLFHGTIAFLETQGALAVGQQREAQVRIEADWHRRLEYIRHLEAEIARKNVALADLESRLRRRPWQRR